MIDPCLVDITLEFLSVSFNSLLYYSLVYPKSVFEPRKKYNIVVYRSVHPQINEYIDITLKKIGQVLMKQTIDCVQFDVLDSQFKTMFTYVFQFENLYAPNVKIDEYLVDCENEFREFCMKLMSLNQFFEDMSQLSHSSSFSIKIHTVDSAPLEIDPECEVVPVEEVEEHYMVNGQMVPIKTLKMRHYAIATFLDY